MATRPLGLGADDNTYDPAGSDWGDVDLSQYGKFGKGGFPNNPKPIMGGDGAGPSIDTPPNAAGQTDTIGGFDPRTNPGNLRQPIPANRAITSFEPGSPIPGAAPMPWLGRGGILGVLSALLNSTPLNKGEKAPFGVSGASRMPGGSIGPGYGQGPFAGRPAAQPDPTAWPDSTNYPQYAPYTPGIGQGPFAGRPTAPPGSPNGQPLGSNAPVTNRPQDRPSYAGPAVASSAVAAQKPNLGYYNMDRPNMAAAGNARGGGGPANMGVFGFDPQGPLFGMGANAPPPGPLAAAVNPAAAPQAAPTLPNPAPMPPPRPWPTQAPVPMPPPRPRNGSTSSGGLY